MPMRREHFAAMDMITLSVYVDRVVPQGHAVFVQVASDLLQMEPCETGERQLWQTQPLDCTRVGREVIFGIRGVDGRAAQHECNPIRLDLGLFRSNLFHKVSLVPAPHAVALDGAGFRRFVHEEIHAFQTGRRTMGDLVSRFEDLARSPATPPHAHLNEALEELILHAWGEEMRVPTQTLLAVASMLALTRDAWYERDGELPSLPICRWVVRHCPVVQEGGDALDDRRYFDRERASGSGAKGVRLAAGVLYRLSASFEWLHVLGFLHEGPVPLSLSEVSDAEGARLVESFEAAAGRLLVDGAGAASVRALCQYCPAVRCLHALVARLTPEQADELAPSVIQRLRSLRFGQGDGAALEAMLREFPFMRSDETSVALLGNRNHPSRSFDERETLRCVQLSSSLDGDRDAGPQLQGALKGWLRRCFQRPQVPETLADDDVLRRTYEEQKAELCAVVTRAVSTWCMVLETPCFRSSGPAILADFSQAYFMSEPEPAMILDVLLQLEGTCSAALDSGAGGATGLAAELSRLATQAAREALDASREPEQNEEERVMGLIFGSPSTLRFNIVAALIRSAETRGAAEVPSHVRTLLLNQRFWSRVFSKTWSDSGALSGHDLGAMRGRAREMLAGHVEELQEDSIQLEPLRAILKKQIAFEELAAQVLGRRPDGIDASAKVLKQFDTDFDHLRDYVRLFCAIEGIEAMDLQRLIDDVHVREPEMELRTAATKFQHLPVRDHLAWLSSLKASDVFAGIWRGTVEEVVEGSPLKQDQVVSRVIPAARSKWEALAKSLETGTAVLNDIRWCQQLDWPVVQSELRTLHTTAPASQGCEWLPRAEAHAKDMRFAVKLREWAPSMLRIRIDLSDIFADSSSDACVTDLERLVETYQDLWERTFGSVCEMVEPYRSTIGILSEAMQDYTIAMSADCEALTWLLKHPDTQEFNQLITLCRPNTDDPVILAAIASLQQTRTFLATVLYASPPHENLRSLLEGLSRLPLDQTVHDSLSAIQRSFASVLKLLTTHSRSPGIQAVYDLKHIHDTGEFFVICSMSESDQFGCATPCGKSIGREALAELRRQLLMTNIPTDLEGVDDVPSMLKDLVERLQLLEELAQCAMELFSLGHFTFELGFEVLRVTPKDTNAEVASRLDGLQQQLVDWSLAVDRARSSHYFLNYYTVREIRRLVRSLPLAQDPETWAAVWPMLRIVGAEPRCEAPLREEILAGAGALAEGAVEALEAFGGLLGRAFAKMPPVVRALEGLAGATSHAQGELLIQKLQRRELGAPIFVCCMEEQSKVMDVVLSIYANRARIPEAEELLLCSSQTTVEQIELLLRRFFHARSHGREERLYCVGNVHLLPYAVQCGAVEALARFEQRFGFEDASALVFISGLQNQMLPNALSQHLLNVSPLPKELLVEAIAKIGESFHGRQMEAVVGEISGVGKTHYIYRKVLRAQQECGDSPVMHHVEVRETADISSLVDSLLSDPTDPSLPTTFFIDLAHILPAHIDTLLFELLVVGVLRDAQHERVYHRRSQDCFCVEIPSTPDELTFKGLPFCMLMPRRLLKMGPDMLEKASPVVTLRQSGNTFAPHVEFKPNADLEVVGKTLSAMEVDAFLPGSPQYSPNWSIASAPDVEPTKAYELLVRSCCSEQSPPSFLVLTNFIRFCAAMVSTALLWPCMNRATLNLMPALGRLPHAVMRLLIETSRDFALRQVPKQTPSVDRLPYRLLVPHALLRTRSYLGGYSRGAPAAPPLVREVSAPRGERQAGPPGARPTLQRQRSHRQAEETQQEAPRPEAEVESSGVGRIGSDSYVRRFDQMPSWETCAHPVVAFNKDGSNRVIGINILSLRPDFLGTFISEELKRTLTSMGVKLERDWTQVTQEEAMKLLVWVEGGAVFRDNVVAPETNYVITVDNMIKLLSVQQRLRFGLPVVLMGETGCGKTALVQFISIALNYSLHTLNVHGGIKDEAVMQFIDGVIEKSDGRPGVLFFDEINAANCMALFKTIIIDRMYGNKRIPDNMRIISCCNPYRLRKSAELEEVALVFKHAAGSEASGITDPMKRLVYRVHPLPESLIDVVSDFGALSDASERLYIAAILRKELPRQELGAEGEAGALLGIAAAGGADSEFNDFVDAFTELLCKSQCFVREVNGGERSVVSMRDISRAARVFKWFVTYHSKLRGLDLGVDEAGRLALRPGLRDLVRSAVVLTMGYCYYARLDRDQRWGYRTRVCEVWAASAAYPAMEWMRLQSAAELEDMLTRTQYEFVSQMDLGDGIALNEGLRENLFMLLVSIMNQIPILLVGKPGCSKSLAMNVLQSNLNGDVSRRDIFKSMPALDVVAYQCSPLSTPEAILNTFASARQSNIGNRKTIVCVLLDEVGLAEESPHLPLKVLHRELEDLRGIACVSISNWALDAAKMSRYVTLYRPAPTVEDLCVTAESMVSAAGNVRGYLRSLSEAFYETYRMQNKADFWGMREFYSSVRLVNSALKAQVAEGVEASLDPNLLMKVVQRNFGGRPAQETERCIDMFFERMGMRVDLGASTSVAELIRQNLREPEARHLMLLTRNNAALWLLFESGLQDFSTAEVMFGSTFPSDQSDVVVAMNLQRIKSCMQRPMSLVMVHCDSLYESLYDLLNQHYTEYAGNRYVRIAHGSKAKLCPIHPKFRIIVITEISDAYFRLAPPLLNRFEKQILLRKALMEPDDEALLKRVSAFWSSLRGCLPEFAADSGSSKVERRMIAGFHSELLASLVFMLHRRPGRAQASISEHFEEAIRLLLMVLTPEAVCTVAASSDSEQLRSKFGIDLVEEYFEKQRHSDLPSFAEAFVAECDTSGAQIMVLTYSPIRGKVGNFAGCDVEELSLHELSSGQDLEKCVQHFYGKVADSSQRHALLIHCDPAASSRRVIEHCRFVCEKRRSAYLADDGSAQGSPFVILVVHLQRGTDASFSFDFDSQWQVVFLDTVEPSVDRSGMPALRQMLNRPLIDVVGDLDFGLVSRNVFRSSLSRLVYPHARTERDLQRQIGLVFGLLSDEGFVSMLRDWALSILRMSPSTSSDRAWFAEIAGAAEKLVLAGTFRGALHNSLELLVGSLLTLLLAHADRNGGLALAVDPEKRGLWMPLFRASLASDLSARFQNDAMQAAAQPAMTAMHAVGTDAATSARPFVCRFPVSWLVSRTIDRWRQSVSSVAPADVGGALEEQYRISSLHDTGLTPRVAPQLLDDYLADFAAMHLQWAPRVERGMQVRILRSFMTRASRSEISSTLDVHRLFWVVEKQVADCLDLINAVPSIAPDAERLIETKELPLLDLDLLALAHRGLVHELQGYEQQLDKKRQKEFLRDWLSRKTVVAGITKDVLAHASMSDARNVETRDLIRQDTEPRMETLALLLEGLAIPYGLELDRVKTFACKLPLGKIRQVDSLHAMLELAKLIHDDMVTACGTFIENFMLGICLCDAGTITELSTEFLRLFCSLAAGLPFVFTSTVGIKAGGMSELDERRVCGICKLAEGGRTIPRSECFSSALLRKLVTVADGEARAAAMSKIEELFKASAEHLKHRDTTFAMHFAVICEEGEDLRLAEVRQEPSKWPVISLEMLCLAKGAAGMLKNLATARWLLARYAAIVCRDDIDPDMHASALDKVDPLLRTEAEALAFACRSCRLFTLKCIERARGLSYLRSLLASPPVSESQWVVDWRRSQDVDVEHFIGATLVPKWNPFPGDYLGSDYRDAKSAIDSTMVSFAAEALDKFVHEGRGLDVVGQRRRMGALLFAFSNAGIFAALEEGEKPRWRAKMGEWLQSSSALQSQAGDRERMLLRVFSGDCATLASAEEAHREHFQAFTVSYGIRIPDLLRWRFLCHLSALLVAAPPGSRLGLLRELMLAPDAIPSSEAVFLPSMDEDIRVRVMRALLNRGENVWRSSNHWYRCTCGERFFIGECGRPMQRVSCPNCQREIGGQNHTPTDATILDTDWNRAPEGYMLPPAAQDEKDVSFREINATVARAMRLLLHGTMLCGLAAQAGDPMPRIFDGIASRDAPCTMRENSEAGYIAAHFARDWQLLAESLGSNEEDLAIGLHTLLGSLERESTDAARVNLDAQTLFTLTSRDAWEKAIAPYLTAMCSDFATQVTEKHQAWSSASSDGKFVSELREVADARDFPADLREARLPQLWAFRAPATLQALQAQVASHSGAQRAFPLVCAILQRPLLTVLPALELLVGIFEWHDLVLSRFSGRLSHEKAGRVRIGDVLDGFADHAERERWQRAYHAFERAWHLAWPHVERHECLEIPEEYRKVMVNHDTALSWFIADSKDEGICALALTQWLTERHNEAIMALGPAHVAQSSRLLGQHEVVRYDEEALLQFARSHCVTYSVGGRLNFDLDKLEQHLRREFDRPWITTDHRAFQWLGENLNQVSELKTAIRQRELESDVVERIRSEISTPSAAHAMLQVVQMASAFLLKSGGASDHAGQMLLSAYTTSVLAESDSRIESATARSEVQLCHLASFERVLMRVIRHDPMEGVDQKYRAELEPELVQQLRGVRAVLPSSVQEHMAGFAEMELRETHLGESVPIATVLEQAMCEDPDAWSLVEKKLPPDLVMRHWVAAYRVLSYSEV